MGHEVTRSTSQTWVEQGGAGGSLNLLHHHPLL